MGETGGIIHILLWFVIATAGIVLRECLLEYVKWVRTHPEPKTGSEALACSDSYSPLFTADLLSGDEKITTSHLMGEYTLLAFLDPQEIARPEYPIQQLNIFFEKGVSTKRYLICNGQAEACGQMAARFHQMHVVMDPEKLVRTSFALDEGIYSLELDPKTRIYKTGKFGLGRIRTSFS